MGKISDRIRGRAEVEIYGVFPEAVINRCAAGGIVLRRVRAIDGQTLRCLAFERDLEAIEASCARCQCELRLLRIVGGSRDRRLLRRRIWLPVTALLAALLLTLSSLFVWDIEIRGASRVSPAAILRALEASGLRRGCFWPALETDLLRSRTLCLVPELAWLGVSVNGSRAVVLVAERAETPEIYADSAPCSLVASHTGVVRRAAVRNGKTLAQPGQAVLEGETLVSGALDNLMGTRRLVRAQGEIWADTWYDLSAVCPVPESGKGEATRSTFRFAIKIGDERINFYGKSRKTLDGYDKIVHEYNLGIDGLFALPVTLVCERYTRCRTEAAQLDTAAVAARLEAYLAAQIEGEIVQSSFDTVERGGAVYVTLRAQCFENIARVQEINQAEAASP